MALGLVCAMPGHGLGEVGDISNGVASSLEAGAQAKEAGPGMAREAGQAAPPAAPIIWRPNVVGAPSGRVGGAVRGTSAFPTPLALAPNHLALTLNGSPSLFWHLDAAAPENVTLVFTLINEANDLPLIESNLALPERSGVNRVNLADYGVELNEGDLYIWSIALVPDLENRARDQVTLGRLKRVSLDREVPSEAREFAARGYWYDALESLSNRIDSDPEDLEARALRRSLLRQAGLEVGRD